VPTASVDSPLPPERGEGDAVLIERLDLHLGRERQRQVNLRVGPALFSSSSMTTPLKRRLTATKSGVRPALLQSLTNVPRASSACISSRLRRRTA
jgi:hypothetical protein